MGAILVALPDPQIDTTGAPPALSHFLVALDQGGIRWSLLRPRATVVLPEGDVDVLVAPADVERVSDALAAAGYVRMPVEGPDVHVATYDEEAGRFVWIHVQAELRIAGASLPAEAVLADADVDGLPQPADSWLLWILLLRALVDKGELPERHRPYVQALAQRWSGGPPALESLAQQHGLEPSEVVAIAAAGDWQGLLRRSAQAAPGGPSCRSRIRGAVARLRHMFRSRGLSVAVLGPDGAGKSTLVQALARSLPLPVRIQYMGLTGGRMPQADALRVPGLVFIARVLLLWARYARGAYHRAGGGIVLFERYTLDGAVPSGMRLSIVGRLSRRLQRRACPMPDLVLLLDASGETLYARSGEYGPEVLERWRGAFERLQESVPQLERIDAEAPAAAVRQEAERRIWRRYVELRARGQAAAGRSRNR